MKIRRIIASLKMTEQADFEIVYPQGFSTPWFPNSSKQFGVAAKPCPDIGQKPSSYHLDSNRGKPHLYQSGLFSNFLTLCREKACQNRKGDAFQSIWSY